MLAAACFSSGKCVTFDKHFLFQKHSRNAFNVIFSIFSNQEINYILLTKLLIQLTCK